MWYLISHNRPELCRRALEYIIASGVSTPGILVVNGSQYPDMPLPDGWNRINLEKNIGYCGAMNWCFKNYPNEKFYGMMGDDEIVTTPFDKQLIEAAGDWNIAHSNDGWQSHRRIHGYAAFGGELIRTMGHIAPPGMWHWYIDNVWEDLSGALGIKKMCADVKTEHLHYLTGKSEKDATYELGESRSMQDAEIYRRWCAVEFYDIVKKVRDAWGDKPVTYHV